MEKDAGYLNHKVMARVQVFAQMVQSLLTQLQGGILNSRWCSLHDLRV